MPLRCLVLAPIWGQWRWRRWLAGPQAMELGMEIGARAGARAKRPLEFILVKLATTYAAAAAYAN